MSKNHVLLIQDFPYHGISDISAPVNHYSIIEVNGIVTTREPTVGGRYKECCVVIDTEQNGLPIAHVNRCLCGHFIYQGNGRFTTMNGEEYVPLLPEYDFNHLKEIE